MDTAGSYDELDELVRNNNIYNFMMEQMSDVLCVLDTSGVIRYISPSRLRVFDETPQDAIGHTFLNAVHQEDVPYMDRTFQQMLKSSSGEVFTVEFRRRKQRLGSLVITEGRGRVLCGITGQAIGAVCVLRDITLRKRSEQQIHYLAHHDVLTELPNRRYFLEQLREAVANSVQRNTPLALIFIDLDNFKQINDSMGHLMGDHLLKAVADRIRAALPSCGVMGRFGGDEFIVYIVGDETEQTIHYIREYLNDPFYIEGHALRLTASIGYSHCPTDGCDITSLIAAADRAMYESKGSRPV